MRCSGIARPTWMSGEVTSIPSFTRNGRPSFSLASSPPSGSTSTAFRVRSEMPTGATLAGVLRLFGRKPRAPKRRRIRKLRLLSLLLVLLALGLSAFTFGLLRAAALAWRLEQQWPKEKILTAYLNTVYFGNGAYGVEQACKVYFGHSADTAHVNPGEAALLAGIPEDPSLWDPVAHPKLARARRNLVLRQMFQQGYLDGTQYRRWVRRPLPK